MEKISRALPGTPLQHTKHTAGSTEDSHQSGRKRKTENGLVGMVNAGNSCYMNATLQALSNCPPFRQYFIDCHHPGSLYNRAADVLSTLFRQIWTSERHPGHLSPRKVSSVMKNKVFKGTQQQDAQEFLRCLLSQIHEEIGLVLPSSIGCGCGQKSCDCRHRDSMVSSMSHDSCASNDSSTKLVRSASGSPLTPKRKASPSPTLGNTRKGSYSRLKWGSKSSLEKVHLPTQQGESKEEMGVTTGGAVSEGCVRCEEDDVFLVNLETELVTLHNQRETEVSDKTKIQTPNVISDAPPTDQADSTAEVKGQKEVLSSSHQLEPIVEVKGQEETVPITAANDSYVDPNLRSGIMLRGKPNKKKVEKPRIVSIVSQVFEGVLESKVTCLSCKKTSVIHEPFHDLSLPIPGRTEMSKLSRKAEDSSDFEQTDQSDSKSGFKGKFRSLLCYLCDYVVSPSTDLRDCLNAFFDACELKGDNKYFCTHCKSFQNSKKQMALVKLPEVLCIHLKRFRFDSFFSTKINRHITFPLTDLDMGGYLRDKARGDHYSLDAIITHIGGAGGGHYIAYARNATSSNWYEFNDTRVRQVTSDTVQNAEGYVLFYRRVLPADSLAAQGIENPSLMPKQGTRLPSADVCYLSRHWLHLAKHCAYPGPIFQYKYACPHGSVVRSDLARQSSLAVRREVWEQYQRKYGGGPLVATLDLCTKCQEKDLLTLCPLNLEQLNTRRKKEREEVQQIQQAEKSSSSKTEPYLLNMGWVKQWQRFIQSNGLDVLPPGPIDNIPLLEVGGDNHTLKLVTDKGKYRTLSFASWTYLHQIYGGGPVIVTSLSAVNHPETTV